MLTKRNLKLENLGKSQLFAADLGVELADASEAESNSTSQQEVAPPVATDLGVIILGDYVASSIEATAADAAFSQLGTNSPSSGRNVFGGDGNGIVLDEETDPTISMPDMRHSSGFVADEEAPGNTPFGPTMLPNKDDKENKKDDEATEDEEEMTDEEVDKLIQFKAPSHFWIHDGDGHRTIIFVK